MRRAAALLIAIALSAGTVHAQSALQRPDDGINEPKLAPDPMLDRPLSVRPAKPKTPPASAAPASGAPVSAKPASAAKPVPASAAKPVVSAAKPVVASAAKPVVGSAKPALASSSAPAAKVAKAAPAVKVTPAVAAGNLAGAAPAPPAMNVNYRQCADSYFAGASLLRSVPDAVDVLLQRAQMAGEGVLKGDTTQDKVKLIQGIKVSGGARAAQIRALDNVAGPKAAQALFRVIRACDAKLNVPITPPLTLTGAPKAAAGAINLGD